MFIDPTVLHALAFGAITLLALAWYHAQVVAKELDKAQLRYTAVFNACQKLEKQIKHLNRQINKVPRRDDPIDPPPLFLDYGDIAKESEKLNNLTDAARRGDYTAEADAFDELEDVIANARTF